MKTFVTFSPRFDDSVNLLNESNVEFFEKEKMRNAVIFTHDKDGSQQLSNELTELEISVSVSKIQSLTTKGLEHSDQLKETKWKIVNNLFLRISKTNNPVIYLGRSTRLHDHLLWLVGNNNTCRISTLGARPY